MNILILGNSSDAHATHLWNSLTQAGATVDYLDTRLFPTKLQVAWRPDIPEGTLSLPSRQLNLHEVHSVFWRSLSSVYVPLLGDANQQKIAFNDAMSTLRSLLKACSARWVNSWEAYEFHQEKPLQLSAVKQIGVTIPATLVSNDSKQISEFARSWEKVIFKPVYGGAPTQLVTESHLAPERLSLVLSLSPVTIQEYIPGTNIRSYVVGKSVYSAEIRSNSLDFREDSAAQLIPVELPASIQGLCLSIAKLLKLKWTAIDWRLNLKGEYVFLEANPSPMFLHFERQTGFPITQQLVNLLVS